MSRATTTCSATSLSSIRSEAWAASATRAAASAALDRSPCALPIACLHRRHRRHRPRYHRLRRRKILRSPPSLLRLLLRHRCTSASTSRASPSAPARLSRVTMTSFAILRGSICSAAWVASATRAAASATSAHIPCALPRRWSPHRRRRHRPPRHRCHRCHRLRPPSRVVPRLKSQAPSISPTSSPTTR